MYYGQNNEDRIISSLIKEKYGDDYVGNILDLGANDGVTLSNSRYFYENNWNAFLIEAGQTPYHLLEKNTFDLRNIKRYNVALGVENGILTFHESSNLLNETDRGLVSSLIEEETTRWKKAGITYNSYEVECFDWNTFVNYFDLQDLKFDIISIDIEGMDYAVLSQMNLEELGCKVLCVEFNGLEMDKYVNYVSKFNMHLVHKNPENLIFIK